MGVGALKVGQGLEAEGWNLEVGMMKWSNRCRLGLWVGTAVQKER
jgi:hypothetical protein